MTEPDRRDETAPPLSKAVLSAVATHKGIDEVALPPLNDAIDPDALDALFEDKGTSGGETIVFEYAGRLVNCSSEGSVDVSDRTD